MKPLTPAQKRLLAAILKRGGEISLVLLETAPELEPDDIVVLPSLVEMQMVRPFPSFGSVQITAMGAQAVYWW